MKIPELFYLRKQTLRAKTLMGMPHSMTVYVYWNYRLTVQGLVYCFTRNVAKKRILELHPEAEFFR